MFNTLIRFKLVEKFRMEQRECELCDKSCDLRYMEVKHEAELDRNEMRC